MRYTPYPYQEHATEHIIENQACGLFLDMGLGKTVSTLTAIDKLMFQEFDIQKVLVIAPKRVAESVWTAEVKKWDHLSHLKLSKVLGTERDRKEALRAKADIYLINRENVPWLISFYGSGFPFDMVVIDELSSFKSAKAIRFKALKQIRPKIKRVVGLTGTPAPNSLLDLWPQLYLLDMGARLGKSLSGYREKYFTPGKRNGHVVFNYDLRKDENKLLGEGYYEKEIYEKIGDICISMRAKDYLSLPERIDRTTEIILPDAVMKQYLEFEKKQILSLTDVEDISAVNAAALTTKLTQFANGAVYGSDGTFHEVHKEKLFELEEHIEAANGKPVLVFYWFRHDLERIKYHLRAHEPKELKTDADIDNWNAGKIKILLAHPASAGHGLNLQAGGNLIEWFSNTWSNEITLQAIARLDRQGQTIAVINNRMVAKGTIDEDIVKALDRKASGQEALMEAVKARIKKYRIALSTNGT